MDWLRRGKILMGLRATYKSTPNRWDIFGGHVEAGETREKALDRELQAELGIRPTTFFESARLSFEEDGQAATLIVYLVEEWAGGEPEMHGKEHQSISWFTIADACLLSNLAANEFRTLFAQLTN